MLKMDKILRVLKTCKYCGYPEFCQEKQLCADYLTKYIYVIKLQDSAFQIGTKKYRNELANPEWKAAQKVKERKWAENRREKLRVDPEKKLQVKAAREKWKENNRDHYLEQHRIHSINRRNRETGERINIEQWKKLCDKYDNKCLACGKIGDYQTLTMDHVIPVIYGGKNLISNIQPLCRECNSSKGTKIIDYRKNNVKEFRG